MYVATIGFFDGVHLGHQFLLRQLWSTAEAEHLQSAIVTFNQHPQTVLSGTDMPLLTPYSERVDLLKQFGTNQIFAFNFEAVHQLSAEEFLRLLHTQCGVDMLLLGYDQHFGADGLRAFADYEAAGVRAGVQVRLMQPAPPFGMEVNGVFSPFRMADGSPMPAPSSSAIRNALLSGDIATANILLGRPYALTGLVVEGRQLGRELGFPTANLLLQPGKLIPAAGVYHCRVSFPPSKYLKPLFDERDALLNIGTNPTVQNAQSPTCSPADGDLSLEVHIPGFEGNLYNRKLQVQLVRYLRPEQTFPTLDALREQIALDLQTFL